MKTKPFKIPRKPTNAGRGSQPNYDRNEKLINDYLSGKYTMAQLVGNYGLSQQRIYEILNNYDVPRRQVTSEGGEK